MHEAVLLAQQAREIFISEQKDSQHPEKADQVPIQICLSLGPFGATLTPTQEFTGFYPPPYGPRGYHPVETDNLHLNISETIENI
jgi:homocysteine S-methyltransferase